MKKRMFAGVIGTVWIPDESDQTCGPVTRDIGKRFSHEFRNASRVQWVKIKDVFQARFYEDLDYCLAFFNASGQLLMSGRKILMAALPPAAKKEVDRLWTLSESKYDLLSVAGVYQLDGLRETRYFINLESEYLSLSIVALANGKAEIVKNVIHQPVAGRPRY